MKDGNIFGNHRNQTGMILFRIVAEIRKESERMKWERGTKCYELSLQCFLSLKKKKGGEEEGI